VIRPIAQVLVFGLCMGSAVPALPAGTSSRQLRCFAVSPGLTLRKQEVADIVEAVRRNSGRPIITIERPDESDYAPAGVVQAVILYWLPEIVTAVAAIASGFARETRDGES
jgi:hypothetical protein